jgi:hypothetical protein
MKKLQLIIAFALVTILTSCSKDEPAPTPSPTNYNEIKLTDIQNRSSLMTAANILASDAVGLLWKKGNVVIFKTSAGTFGKFEVVEIEKVNNYALVLNITIFNPNGSTKNIIKGLLIRGTWGCNLDIPEEDVTSLKADFFWSRPTQFDTYLVPNNGAVFLKYAF